MASNGFPRPQPTHYPHGTLNVLPNSQGGHPFYAAGTAPSIRITEAADPTLPSTPFLERSSFASKEAYYSELPRPRPTKRPFYKRPCVWICSSIIAVIIIVVTVLGSQRAKHTSDTNPNQNSSAGGAGQGGDPSHPTSQPKSAVVTGGDGSTITKEDGTTFTYHNPFGGYCTSSPLQAGYMYAHFPNYTLPIPPTQGCTTRRTRSTTARARTRGRPPSAPAGTGAAIAFTA